MGALPSTPRGSSRPQEAAEFLIGVLVGDKSYPVKSDLWQKLLEVPLTVQWPQHRVLGACEMLAQNNYHTRHLAKILMHLVWILQDLLSTAVGSSANYSKATNAAYIASIFLKYLIENAKADTFDDLYLTIDEGETTTEVLLKDENIPNFVMRGVLTFISVSEISPQSFILHHELLNFVLVAMSTQLHSLSTPGLDDVHPFIDAAMIQESTLVCSIVHKLLVNYIARPHIGGYSYPFLSEEMKPGVLQRVGSVAANFVLLPYYTFNSLISSSVQGSRNLLADNSLLVLLILVHYRKRVLVNESVNKCSNDDAPSNIPSKESSCFSINPYCKSLENARDIEFDRLDIEGNAQSGPVVRLSFASLFDTLGLCLSEESSVLLLYFLVHGNSDFVEYVLVRTDLDTLLMPMLETLYNAQRRTSYQIYLLLIVLLILSQDSSFNSSIHKLILPHVPWYQERLLHNTSLGSLMIIILIRTVKYNLSKLRDLYLHTNCLATLANMAPHVHGLSGYASQRLVSLFDMLARKYTKLVERNNDKGVNAEVDQVEDGDTPDDVSAELQIYTDFLRIVLEILNAILTYRLTQNPEVVYAVMHQQEIFQPFKNHPQFNELLENIYTVLDFFNNRLDTQQAEGEWSVDKVLQIIIINCRSWHGEGMKMFAQLNFTYEQESHPEEFFIPYVWQLVLSTGFTFDTSSINLFPTNREISQ